MFNGGTFHFLILPCYDCQRYLERKVQFLKNILQNKSHSYITLYHIVPHLASSKMKIAKIIFTFFKKFYFLCGQECPVECLFPKTFGRSPSSLTKHIWLQCGGKRERYFSLAYRSSINKTTPSSSGRRMTRPAACST